MAYILDTDIYIYLLEGNRKVLNKILEVGEENIFFSAISVAELYFGAFNSKKIEDNLNTIQKNLEKLQILNFTKNTAKIFGRLKSTLKQQGKIIADMDLALSAIAIHHQSILVTHNTKHFSHIQELILEDWT